MKKAIIFLLVSVCFCNCSKKKETIGFIPLHATEFNSKSFALPISNDMVDSLKQAHDNCMGFSFDANAFFLQTKDTFSIGSIVNRQSLKILNRLDDLGLTRDQESANFNILSNPCYEKRVLHFPLKSIIGEKFTLQLPNPDATLNKEVNDAISASGETEMQTSAWMYVDMKDVLKKILDSAHTPGVLNYKNNLLDTANMVLTTVESITDVRFIINTAKDISAPLEALLKRNSNASQLNVQVSMKLAYIDRNKFQVILNGFFPVVGQFMKAELK